ncbi:uncharacterized protein LOC111693808 [Trichogramma pretiosum]|uniref:uncharacterized protein LOC111693808 n=1 Tax=Trichogramma pretiosum TaxID=7493 RepID=UPI000C719E8A|nr:uncharacterized protein LOC111693808 [Trichogramma pretiosum]
MEPRIAALSMLLLLLILAASQGAHGCGYPGAPAHSSVRFSGPSIEDVIDEEDGPIGARGGADIFVPGTVSTYTCERGFELLGPGRRICQADGSWSPEGVPFCEIKVNLYRYMASTSISVNLQVAM